MEELKAMVTAIMDSLIKMTERAVTAERLENDLRANITKAREDAEFWRKAYDRVKAKLDEMEEKNEEH